MNTFFNTINISGEELKQAVRDAADQDRAVLLIYENTGKSFSPSQILKLIQKTGKNPPITSIRRSITNLTSRGKLVKTEEMVKGLWNKPEHKWKFFCPSENC